MGAETQFEVRLVGLDGQVELAVRGEIDSSTAGLLGDAIDAAMRPGRPVVLDMQRTTFFDASGLRVLLRALEALDRDPTKLVVRSPSRIVLRVLRATGTDRLMTISHTGHESWPATGSPAQPPGGIDWLA